MCRTRAPDLARRINNHWHKQHQHPGQLSAQHHHHRAAVKIKVKNCCRNSASTLDIAYCTRSMSLTMRRNQRPGRVLLKKCRRPPQDRVVQIVAQVGDHAEARHSSPGTCPRSRKFPSKPSSRTSAKATIVHAFVKVAKEQTAADKSDGPCRGIVNNCMSFGLRSRIQHAVKDGSNQQHPERIQQAHRRHQKLRKPPPATSRAPRIARGASVAA